MFYKFEKTLFVLFHHYLLKSFKFNIEQNQFIDLTIGYLLFSPVRIDDYRKVIGKNIQKLKITNNKAVIK